jgi:type IX secretion system PorP/SprF family membrane protein
MSIINSIELNLKRHLCVLLSIALMLSVKETQAQQQTQFTNILLNQYLYNPAFAGSFHGMQFNAGSRLQWTGFEGAPRSYMASGYGTLKKRSGIALGGMVLNDQMGLLNRTSLYTSFSYHLKLNDRWKMGFGLSAGFVQYNVKAYNAKPYDKDDIFLTSSILNANAFDANAGFLIYQKKFFFGVSGQQLPSAKIHWDATIGRLTPHFYAYTGLNIVLDKKKKQYVLQPSVLMRFNAPSPFEVEYNLKLTYKSMLWLGASFRHAKTVSAIAKQWQDNAVCGMLGLTISKQFTFGYSYDMAINNLRQYNSGSHELIISYTILSKKDVVKDKVQAADEDELNTIDNSMKTNIKSQKKK